MFSPIPRDFSTPLMAEEVISCLQHRWRVTYDLRLVARGGRVYLHMMWAYLEQQSFPLNEKEYRIHLNEVLEVVNRLGQGPVVREWLATNNQKPRVGRAVILQLKADERLEEFVLGVDR